MYGGPDADTFVLDAECDSKDVIFDFINTTDEILLPVDVFLINASVVANGSGTGSFINASDGCSVAFVAGATPEQILPVLSEQ